MKKQKQAEERLTGRQLDEILKQHPEAGKFIDNGNGHHEYHFKEGHSRLYYREDQVFSPGLARLIWGVLKVFGIISGLIWLVSLFM